MTATDAHHGNRHEGDRGHFWRPRSSHATSEGWVTYETCACGRWRITTTAPSATTAEIARSPRRP